MSKPNWDKIKQEFLESDIEEAREFLRINYGSIAVSERTIDNRTKGWRDKRKEFKAKITAKVQEKIINNPIVQNQNKSLLVAMKNIEIKVAQLLGQKADFTIDDLAKIRIGYEILRLATGQSTNNLGGDKDNPVTTQIVISTNLNNYKKNE